MFSKNAEKTIVLTAVSSAIGDFIVIVGGSHGATIFL